MPISCVKPFITETIMIMAMAPTTIPAIEIPDIMLIIFCFFLETRYLLAIKNGKFKVVSVGNYSKNLHFQQVVDVFNIVQTVVDVKLKIRNYAQAFSNLSTKFSP